MNTYRAFILLSLFAAASTQAAGTPQQQNQILGKVRFDQNLNAQIPLDLPFRDENGHPVLLSHYAKGKPLILSLVYYQCPMLCTESLNGLLRAMRSLSFSAGNQYNVVTVSFDPRETPELAEAKKKLYVERYGRRGAEAGWAFLVGDEGPVRRLADAAGFHYVYDPELQQYAHATGIVVLTPSGRISRYLFGVEYSARDLELALLEASAGKIGTTAQRLLLFCYHYDPLTGKYNLRIFRILQGAGAATVMALAAAILIFLRRERKAASC